MVATLVEMKYDVAHGGLHIDFGATLGLRHNNGENFSLGWAAPKINYYATKLSIILY